jgi:hypothetical protein
MFCGACQSADILCYKQKFQSDDLYNTFTDELKIANIQNDVGNKLLMSAIQNPINKNNYKEYEDTLLLLNRTNNDLATLLLAALWMDSGQEKKCTEAKRLLITSLRNTQNPAFRTKLIKLLGSTQLSSRRNASHQLITDPLIKPDSVNKESNTAFQSDSSTKSDVKELPISHKKSLLIIFED